MNSEQPNKSAWPYRQIGFLAVQIVFVVIVIGGAGANYYDSQNRRALPPLRQTPIKIGPQYDCPWIVSDDQLTAVLHKLRPRLRGPKPKINYVDHALRFWGSDAVFDDPECLSGREMRDLLVNHATFAKAWGKDTEPLLTHDHVCTHVRTKEGDATASHTDHTLATLAEVGAALDFAVATPQRESTVRSILEASLRRFSLNQLEYEWSTLAYVLYFQPVRSWVSSEGQEITFDRLADRMMRQKLSQGVCYGNHRLHTLVILLRVDEQHSILTPQCRQRIIEHLRHVVSTLVLSQDAEGWWNEHWAKGAPLPEGFPPGRLGPLSSRLLATGHALEWLALAPEEVHPPREALVAAGQWLSREISEMDDDVVEENYTFLTHAGSALALWRGRAPADCVGSMHVAFRRNQ